MLVAQREQAEPAWTPVMGARVLFAPITRTMLRRARRAALEALGVEGADGGEQASPADQMEELGDALSRALIVAGALDWQDVALAAVDQHGATILDDEGDAVYDTLDFTPENLLTVLSDALVFEAFDAAYVIPYVMRERERAAPGKESSPSPNGISTKAMEDPTIAGSPAAPATATDASNARTGCTKPKAIKKKTSGPC
ncbi:hypothetical protein ASE75_06030 [Sphingomonas sp. Leaf17]|uniref:hypothetical protein n=1 Tax=Sphingomonas sp. Leaf17 TaxID=1735683 RepID=UPI0006F3222C|nr:hypothetical protein [Sphingomonas sp. Leaf17]KQM65787.1 hypothetical protein ASE75_06030 [Sphingomonas sp. Leaf17]